MKLLVQRVSKASVKVEDKIVGEIDKGLLIFFSVAKDDLEEYKKKIDYLIRKILTVKFFEEPERKFAKDIKEVNGKALIVSQFTLEGRVKKGTKPDFSQAALPADAEKIYNEFVKRLSEEIEVETGRFGAYMRIELMNDGPVTFLLEK